MSPKQGNKPEPEPEQVSRRETAAHPCGNPRTTESGCSENDLLLLLLLFFVR